MENIIKLLKEYTKENVPDFVKNKIVLAQVLDCHDGDTCTIVFLVGNEPVKIQIRLAGIDTAEKARRKDASDVTFEEYALCAAATQFVKDRILDKCVEVRMHSWCKWGGRVIGDIYSIDETGTAIGDSLSKQLLDAHLAVPYDGKKKQADWKGLYEKWKGASQKNPTDSSYEARTVGSSRVRPL